MQKTGLALLVRRVAQAARDQGHLGVARADEAADQVARRASRSAIVQPHVAHVLRVAQVRDHRDHGHAAPGQGATASRTWGCSSAIITSMLKGGQMVPENLFEQPLHGGA